MIMYIDADILRIMVLLMELTAALVKKETIILMIVVALTSNINSLYSKYITLQM